MKCKKTLVVALWAMFISFAAVAQKGNEQQLEKEANALFKAGDYLKAYPLYSQLLALYPAHADYNYKFGACAIYSDPDKTKAVKFLTIATSKALDDPMAWYYLGKAYHLNYQFKDAIKSYENFIRKADPKVVAKTDAQRSIETCIYGSNLLANIKDIDVISKTDADKNNFFRYFNLEEVGGKILTVPDGLKTSMDKKSKETGVMHYTGNGTTIFFSSFGKDGTTGKDIYKAKVLPDGKFSTPEKIKGDVNTKYDEDFCFMHSDGKTLYFSSKGHNSMGGYDVFKSAYDPETDSFGPAINMDFAINTPDDDIFYITDSLNQRAYFASGRSSDLNHLSVYNVMTQSNPLQVVYVKGEFFSEINKEQKNASFKVIDPNTNRMVCEANTNPNTGNYVLYVPRSGEYLFKVVTENSPAVHEIKVGIPVFDRPVALRQEMRLISENGRDKIIFTNHFATPLDEDLASLAADMLRKKAGLEANVSADDLTAKTTAPAANAHALEPVMQNAPLAAGFADGVTVKNIISDMEMELSEVKSFVAESDQKYDNSFAYALKKQKEADVALVKAEMARKSASGYTSNEDIAKLRESQAYTVQAEALQREAIAAMNAAEMVKQYKEKEAARATALDEKVRTLKQSEATNNFDAAVAALKDEKERKNAQANGSEGSSFAELMNQAREKETEMQTAEKTLSEMRARETTLEASVKTSQDKINNATKKNDRQAAENEYLAEKAELDKLRKNIVTQNAQIKKLSNETKIAFANVEVYKRLASDTGMGLTASEKRTFSESEKTALSMKLEQMNHRIDALEITDQKTLAMVIDASMEQNGSVATTSVSKGGSITVRASSEVNGLPSGNSAGTKHTTSEPAGSPQNIAAATLKSDKDLALQRTGKSPAMASTRKMYIAGSLEQTNQQIAELEAKKKQGALNTADNKQLTELAKLQKELQQELAMEKTMPAALSSQEFNSAVASYIPNYVSDINVITARSSNEVERTAMKYNYKNTAVAQLKEARIANAMAAMSETDESKIAAHTQKDKQLESAIAQLERENEGSYQFTAAYEKESKMIASSDATEEEKAQSHADLTAQYIAVLDKTEADKQQKLNATSDLNVANQIQMELAEIKTEKAKATTGLNDYQKQINLAAASTTNVSGKANAKMSLEDEMELEAARLSSERSGTGEKKIEDVTDDAKKAEKIFKPRVEAESIFAYESGIFEEIVTKNKSAQNELKHRDKIAELNNQIFLVEGEMENTTNDSKLRKLDYQAEQLYLKRSLIEIDNSPAIARMAAMEYETESARAKELTQTNRDKIDSRDIIKNEIAKLEREAAANMEAAEEMRKISPSVKDDIERADHDRQAFAKEALAIEQLRQIQEINNNIDMLLSYTDVNLAELKTGTVPKEYKQNLLNLAENNATLAERTDSTTLPDYTAPKTEVMTGTSSDVAITNPATEMPAQLKSTSVNVTENSSSDKAANTAQANQVTENKQTVTVKPETASALQNEIVAANAQQKANSNQTVTSSQANSSNKNNASATVTKSANTNSVSNQNSTAVVTAVSSNKSGNEAQNATASATVNTKSTVAVAQPVNANTNATVAMASDYFYSAPKSLTSDIFSRTNRAAYNNSQPIPIDMEMPAGIYYKVQVGAFRNDIPQNLYDEFAPVCGERLTNGITRYTAGFFMNFENADAVKKEIRSIGYGDAFVVAFKDGKRIPLYEAMGITEGQNMMASVEKEYIYGDKGEAPKSSISSTVSKPAATSTPKESKPKTNKGSNSKNNTNTTGNGAVIYTVSHTSGGAAVSDYYAGFPEAAKATKVEVTQGLFFTVQVGVYSRPVAAKSLHYINPLNSELTTSKKIRYTSGMYTSMQDAVDKRSEARALGITDAFVTAYYNGQRITLSDADKLLKEKGTGILVTKGIN